MPEETVITIGDYDPENEDQAEKLEYLKDLTLARIDELIPEGLEDTPVKYLEKELSYAALDLLRKARIELVYEVARQADVDQIVERDCGILVPCPEDYLRFVRIRLKGWGKAVDSLQFVDSPTFQNQTKGYMTAKYDRPVAGLVPFVTDCTSQAVHCFPAAKKAVKEFIYIPEIHPVHMPDNLIDPMVWMAAARSLIILRRGDLASQAMQMASNNLMPLRTGLLGEELPQQE